MNESGLLQKQEQLIAKSQFLRASLTQQIQEWRPSLSAADKCLSVLAWLHHHPIIPVLGLSVITINKPAWLFTTLRTVFTSWLSLRSFRK